MTKLDGDPGELAVTLAAGVREGKDGSRNHVVSGTDRSTQVKRDQRGMVSAEWAVGIIAAVAMAGVLLAVVTTGPVQEALLKVVLTIIKNFV